MGSAGARVVAHEEHRVERGVDPLHHRPRLGVARDELRALVQLLGQQVAHVPVAVVDQDAGGTGLERARYRRVRFGGHQAAEPRVLRRAAGVDGVRLIPVDDARDALHVDREVDFHG